MQSIDFSSARSLIETRDTLKSLLEQILKQQQTKQIDETHGNKRGTHGNKRGWMLGAEISDHYHSKVLVEQRHSIQIPSLWSLVEFRGGYIKNHGTTFYSSQAKVENRKLWRNTGNVKTMSLPHWFIRSSRRCSHWRLLIALVRNKSITQRNRTIIWVQYLDHCLNHGVNLLLN